MNPERLLPPAHFTDSPQESSAAPQCAAVGGGATASAGNTEPRHDSPSGFTGNINVRDHGSATVFMQKATVYQIQGNSRMY